MSTEVMERSNRATVLLELLKETIGVETTIEKTTWREISAKFGELMEQANTELREKAIERSLEPETKEILKSIKKTRKKNETVKN